MKPEYIIGLSLAIESGYIQNLEKIKKWAEIDIVDMDKPPLLILNIYDSKDLSEVLVVLAIEWKKIPKKVLDTIDYTAIYLGFSYLRFMRGEIDLLQLLLNCGKKTDSSNYKLE
jgi:hypothetical protein